MNFGENVHFRISLSETLFVARYDAVCRRKNLASRLRSLNLRLALEGGEKLHGDVPFPAKVGQETQRNKNFCGPTRGIY